MRFAERLDSIEVASGLVFGQCDEDDLPPFGGHPLEALEEVAREALSRQPCLVSFSGGRDSSIVLAVATAVARRESLPLPIPVTARFPAVPTSYEDDWQELVVTHLRLEDWLRLDFADELDVVGPYARRALLRHGLLWPFNTHFHLPFLDAASGGSLLTGIGGDELLGESTWTRQLDLLTGRAAPTPRDMRRLAFFAAPSRPRAWWLRRRFPLACGWLREAPSRELARRWATQVASEPRLPRPHARWRGSFRYQRIGLRSLALLAADTGTTLAHPFLDPRFRSAVVASEALLRFRSRTEATQALACSLLPAAALSRTTKSSFDSAFLAAPSREFGAAWSGRGLDEAVVDPDALRTEWLGTAPDARSFLALQAAWLADASARQPFDQRRDDVRERVPVTRSPQLDAR